MPSRKEERELEAQANERLAAAGFGPDGQPNHSRPREVRYTSIDPSLLEELSPIPIGGVVPIYHQRPKCGDRHAQEFDPNILTGIEQGLES